MTCPQPSRRIRRHSRDGFPCFPPCSRNTRRNAESRTCLRCPFDSPGECAPSCSLIRVRERTRSETMGGSCSRILVRIAPCVQWILVWVLHGWASSRCVVRCTSRADDRYDGKRSREASRRGHAPPAYDLKVTGVPAGDLILSVEMFLSIFSSLQACLHAYASQVRKCMIVLEWDCPSHNHFPVFIFLSE